MALDIYHAVEVERCLILLTFNLAYSFYSTPFIQQLPSQGPEEPRLRAAEEQVFKEDDDPDRLHGRRQHVANHPRGGKTG